ncbi:MAG: S1/P1 nuclease [Alistipes sp.]|nr:S1/P1 nuclease [Alistipes sp.]
MKRLLTIVAALLFAGTTFAWSVREHATVAQIAERHLTPKAKELVRKYMGGRPMAYYASHADFFRNEMIVDIGFEPEEGSRKVIFPHTFHVDKKFNPYREIVKKGERKPHGNMLYHLERIVKGLAENHATMNDSVRLVHLYLVIHGIGDMHCPMHMRFIGREPSLGTYKVLFGKGNKKRPVSYHGLWDARMISTIHPWSYRDMAELFDIYTEKEIAKFCKGDIYAWGKEVAVTSFPLREYKEGDEIDEIAYRHKYQQFGEELLTKAGYRLAKVLNQILK